MTIQKHNYYIDLLIIINNILIFYKVYKSIPGGNGGRVSFVCAAPPPSMTALLDEPAAEFVSL